MSDLNDVRPTSVLPLLCLAGAVVFWGTSFVAMKVALDDLAPMAVVWLRMAIASLVIMPFMRTIPRPEYRRGDWKWLAAMCLWQPCLYYLFEGYAINYTTSSQAGMISALVPLLVAVGAWLFLAEKLSLRAAVGVAVSLAGVFLLSAAAHTGSHAPNPVLGNSLELLAMISAAGYMLVVKHLSSRYHPWLLTSLIGFSGTVFFLPWAALSHPVTWLSASAQTWIAVAYLGVVVTLGAFGLYNVAVSKMKAGQAAMAINLVPAVAVISGWAVLGETLNTTQIIACAVIALGVFMGEKRTRVKAEQESVAFESV